jgi:RNA polymerase sigma-70 factor, ECF subfamily
MPCPYDRMNDRAHEPTDERLIQATLAGDDEAFAALVRRYRSRVFGIASRFARNDHELDDVCQEIFIKAYRNLANFRGDAPFGHWLSRVAVRACYDLLRKTRRDRANVSLDSVNVTLTDIEAYKFVEASETRELLEFALGHLNAKDRLVITLLELEEKSVREVAELTGWTESNVKVRAFRARQALKKILQVIDDR